jgi:tRNA A37 threonylcarbamoyladenosine dehydratase
VGYLELVDSDRVSLSNINRQIIALHSTVGRYKTEVMKERIHDINPDTEVVTRECFFLPENASEFDFSKYDYVVDAVDTVTAKIALIMSADRVSTPIISSMGAGNKLDPTKFQVADIYKTSVCPLAKVMRRELRKRGIKHLKCVYSTEEALSPTKGNQLIEKQDIGEGDAAGGRKKSVPGSVSFVPSVAGLIIAGEIIRDLSIE